MYVHVRSTLDKQRDTKVEEGVVVRSFTMLMLQPGWLMQKYLFN
jgi:hypothetical protein